MQEKRFIALVLLLCLLATGNLPVGAAPVAPADTTPPGPATAVSAEPSSSWQAAVRQNIRQSEYQVTWQNTTYLPDLSAAYQAPNRAQGFRTYFTPEGIRVIPRVGAGWELGVSRERGEQARLVPAANQVLYESADRRVGEWYVNSEEGLEWSAVVDQEDEGPRAQDQGAPLLGRWSLTFAGLSPRLAADDIVEFVDAAGAAILRYGPFTALDARGQATPVQVKLGPCSASPAPCSLLLAPASSAAYPLTVHATLVGSAAVSEGLSPIPDWMGESNQANASFGISASTVGDVNGDGYSDAIVAAYLYDNGQTDEGAVFIYYGRPTGLGTTAGWMAESDQAGANMGRFAVDTAGDVNGDGYSDVLVGAWAYDNGQSDEGSAWLWYGSAAGLGPNGTPANADWTAESDQGGAHFGVSAATAGDVNGDGYSDIIVGAGKYDNGQADEGAAFVWYGSASGMGPNGTPANADWMAESNQDIDFGNYVGTAGDVNGDGYAEVIVGMNWFSNGQSVEGGVFLWYGSATGLGPNGNLANADWSAESNQVWAAFGCPAGTAGDVNGDGYGDVLAGAGYYSNGQYREGMIFVWYGSATGLGPNGTPTNADWAAESNQDGAELGNGGAAVAGDVNGDGYADVIAAASGYDNGQSNEGAAFVWYGGPGGLGPNGIPANADWTAESNQDGAGLGGWEAVGTAGDVNGDGYSDVIAGASGYDNGQTDEGAAFAYYGGPAGLSSTAGWVGESDQASAYLGLAVGTAGDVNGDGYSDVVVGAPLYDNGQTNEGRAYVYHGSAAGLSSTAAWMAEGDQAGSSFGLAVGTTGDVNGDGYSDVVVGAPGNDNGQTDEGRVYVYHGSATGLAMSPAWMAESDQAGSSFGIAAGTAGDVNGDGYSDLIVGAEWYDNGQTDEGRAYVYHGSATGLASSADWTSEGNQGSAFLGHAAGTAGDVNGDGYSDVVVGAYWYDNGQANEGRAWVYHGSAAGLSSTAAWMAESNQSDANLGWSVGTAGDVNGDGYSDLAIGAPAYSNGQGSEGRAFVYHGSATGLGPNAAWTAESNQDGARFGQSAGAAGDVNGDGYGDVIVGAHQYDNGQANEGGAWVYHGSAAGLTVNAAWAAESGQASAEFGYAARVAGDVNGDGYSDVIVGAGYYDNDQTDEGRAFLYYGNAGAGLSLIPRQMRTDGSVPIAPLGISDAGNAFQLRLTGRMPLGREKVKLQYQVAPLGTPFTATGAISGTSNWIDTGVAGTVIVKNVTGLEPGWPYHWRVRLLYRAGNRLGQPASRWLTIPWDGWNEKDLRTADGPITGLEAWNDSPTVLGQTTALTATSGPWYATYAWDFGDGQLGDGPIAQHTYQAAGIYTALVTASNGLYQATATTVVTVEEVIAGLAAVNDSPTELGRLTTLTATVTGGTLVHYSWDLGDGQTADGPVVTHLYTTTGVYTAVVTARNDVSQAVTATAVTVYCDPPYNITFDWTPLTPTVGEIVSFSGHASGTAPLEFWWDFGDGGTDTGQQVQHAYVGAGTYSVTLLVLNECGEAYAIQVLTVVEGCNPPSNLSFTWEPPSPVAGDPTTFTGSSAGTPPLNFTWSFGGSGITATHVFTPAGDYPVTMTVTNACGHDALLQNVHVCDPARDASLSWAPGVPVVGEVVVFTGAAAGEEPLAYAWDLGDGSMGSGVTVTHAYSALGDYTVKLTVTNGCGQAVVQRVVHVCAPVQGAALAWTPLVPAMNQTVTFTGTASGEEPIAFAWAFGDGGTGGGPSPTHTYTAGGDYVVVLTATNACGEQAIQDTLHVCEQVHAADFGWLPADPVAGQPVTLTAAAQGEGPLAYTWDMGDGNMDTGPNPVHTYVSWGDYTVVLTVTNACGEQVISHVVHICGPATGATFTWLPLQPTPGEVITLTASVQGEPAFSYAWAFGDGGTGSGAVVTHNYITAGTYTVTLDVTNACGASRFVRTVQVAAPQEWRAYLPLVTVQSESYEPDNTWEQANRILIGRGQYHLINPVEDQDWVVFTAQVSVTYDILVYDTGPVLDSYLDLYNQDGITPIDSNDDCAIPPYASCITFTPSSEGDYYARVSDYDWAGGPTGYGYWIVVQVRP